MSNIEWTEKTWNPITGCTKVSAGCKNCYAKTLHDQRHKAFLEGKLQNHACYSTPFEEVRFHPERLDIPRKIKKPTMFFVNSMSDLFHEQIRLEDILKVFDVMNQCEQDTFQVLTKRPENLFVEIWLNEPIHRQIRWTSNIWLGVSVENTQSVNRIELLKQTPAKVKFLSIEPLLEDLGELDLKGIDWVIVGGESGKNARPMNIDWVRNIKDQCQAQNVPFFMKQFSQGNFGQHFKYNDFDAFPEDLRIREYPNTL